MEGSNKGAGSRGTWIRRHRKTFGNWLRNRLGERYLIPVAQSLFAVHFYNHFFEEFRRSMRFAVAAVFRKAGIIFFTGLALIVPVEKVRAVPICENKFDYAWCGIESGRADWDLYGYNMLGLPYPERAYCYFNEGDNIEWIYYALENQYAFLDDTLYRIMGGCYLLGPVCYPLWHGFRYYYCLGNRDREIIYISGNSAACIDNAESDDITALTALDDGAGLGHSLAGLCKLPGRTYPVSENIAETETVPEPSTITLFGLAALLILRCGRIGRKLKAGG